MGNGSMGADLPTLDWLAAVLVAHADTIGKLKVDGQVTMPGSPIQDLSAQVAGAAVQAFGLIGGNWQQMSTTTKISRDSYEALDTAFATQLHTYTSGIRAP
jgi:hypothetical protein